MAFDHYCDIYDGVTADSIRKLADDPKRAASSVQQIADEMTTDHSKVGSNTDGDIKAPLQNHVSEAKSVATKLAANGAYATGVIDQFANSVEKFDNKVTEINSRLFTMARSLRGMNDPDVKMGHAEPAMTQAEANKEAMANLAPEYNTALQTLDDEADAGEKMLNEGATPENVKALVRQGLMPFSAATALGVTLTADDKAAYYLATLEGKTPEEKVKYLLDNDIDPEVAALILGKDPEIAKEAVKQAKSITDGINKGTFKGSLKEEVEKLLPYLEKFNSSLAFSGPLINQLGPKGLMQLNLNIALATDDRAPDVHGDKDGGAVDPEMGELIAKFQKEMGITLGVASGGPDGYPEGTPSEYKLDPDYMSKLYDAGNDKIKAYDGWFEDDPFNRPEVYGYQALAPLLANGQYDTQFLTSVGNGMYSFEQTTDEHGNHPWSEIAANLGPNHGLRLDWTEGDGSTHAAGLDPMRALMKGLANNPEASQQFFSDSTTYSDGEEYNTKLHYFLNERPWGGGYDQPWMGDGAKEDGYFDRDLLEQQNNTHAMNPLGDAIAAATSFPDSKSAELAGELVHEVANKSDLNSFGDIRDSLAEVTKQHMGAINAAFTSVGADENGDIDPFTPGIQYDPKFDPEDDVDLQKFLAEIGRDSKAKEEVVGAQALYMQSGYATIMADPDDSLTDRIGAIGTRVDTPMGYVLGALDYGTSDQTFDDQEESDAQHNSDVESKYKVIGFFVDQIPFSKMPIGGDLTSMGVNSYLDQLKQSEMIDTTSVANQLVGDLHGGSENHIKSTAEMTLLAYMSPADRQELGIDWPEGEDGKPKPISQWDEDDQAKINGQLTDNQKLMNVLGNHGDNARQDYQNAFDSSKTNIKQKG